MTEHNCNQSQRLANLEGNNNLIMQEISDMRKENKEAQEKMMDKIEDINDSVNEIKLDLAKNFPTKEDLNMGLEKKAGKWVETSFSKVIWSCVGVVFTVVSGVVIYLITK